MQAMALRLVLTGGNSGGSNSGENGGGENGGGNNGGGGTSFDTGS